MTKIKIHIGTKELSQKEIEDGKNFQTILKKFEQVKIPFYKRPWFLISSGITLLFFTSVIVTTKLTKVNTSNEPIEKAVQKDEAQDLEKAKTSEISVTTNSISPLNNKVEKINKIPDLKKENTSAVLSPLTEAERMKEINILEQVIDSLKNQFQKLNHNLPVEPKMARKNGYTFNIDVLPDEFPEISIYKDVVFELEESKKDEFKEITAIDWEKGDLKDNVKGLNYLMILQKEKDIRKFVVYPVYQGKSYEDAVYEYHKYLHELDEIRSKIDTKENQLKEISTR